MKQHHFSATLTPLICVGAASLFVGACTNERGGHTGSTAGNVGAARVDTLVLPARRDIDVLLHLRDEIPRELQDLAKSDTIDPVGLGRLGESAVVIGESVAIADGNRVVIVDSTHHRISSAGRQGKGPNEFDGNVEICKIGGDTIVAMDGIPRITVINSAGRIVRQFSFPAGVYTHPTRCMSDGTFITSRIIPGDSLAIEHYDMQGTRLGAVTRVRSAWRDGGSEVMAPQELVYNNGSLFWGNSWEPLLREFAIDGTIRRIIRLSDAPQIRSKDPNQQLGFAPKAGSGVTNWSPIESKFEHYPYYYKLRVTSNGDIWLRDFPHFFPATERWTGFSHDGKSLGAVSVDSAAAVDRRISIEEFYPTGVLVRYETPAGPVYFKQVPFLRR